MKKNRLYIVCICFVYLWMYLVSPENVRAASLEKCYPAENFSDYHAEDLTLYAKSAVLIDCSNRRILYGKNANTPMPNASTTKILTCILALESGKTDEIVTVSEYACSMPQVKLGFSVGDTFYLEDLLYSLMLESHNDSAVAIAEHIAGSVEKFAEMMNQKAEELGCKNSHFITPNGLDAEDEGGIHATTAYDLSCIMSYCIENPEFLTITQTVSRQIQNTEGTKSYSLNNHNALLQMVDGVISGKTGFTGKAGYCYVGAYEKDGRTYAFALLACGWPNNRNYKWSDAKQLIAYGNEKYQLQTWSCKEEEMELLLEQGVRCDPEIEYPKKIHARADDMEIQMLLSDTDEISTDCQIPEQVFAPANEGTAVGIKTIYLNQYPIAVQDIYLTETVERFDLSWCVRLLLYKLDFASQVFTNLKNVVY